MAVNLTKGQRISLEKTAGNSLSRVMMGLGWDPVETKGFLGFGKQTVEIDLDASCLMFDEKKQLIDSIWFRQLRSKDDSVVHSGDNRTGKGDGDDEQITINLQQIPQQVKTLVFTVNSFTGQNFSQVQNAFCRLVDLGNNQEIARYNLSSQGGHTGQIMAKLYRHEGEWKMQALGENTLGRTLQEIMLVLTGVV